MARDNSVRGGVLLKSDRPLDNSELHVAAMRD